MINVGNYTFTLIDARNTLGKFEELWDGYLLDHDPTAFQDRRSEVLDGFAGLDLDTASEAELTKPLTSAWTAFLELGPALRSGAADVEGGRQQGSVDFLALSKGGVPKSGVQAVDIDYRGVIGDAQKNRMLHGHPFQALCLWSSDVIEKLQTDGHPLSAGQAGENVTVGGIDWGRVRPGARLAFGSVLCEVSTYTSPCAKNSAWFLDGDFKVMDVANGPVSRVYATVIEPGRVTVGDRATLEP